MNKRILNTDTSLLKVVNDKAGNIGNCVCDRIESTFWGKGGRCITTIPNFEIGKTYKQESIMIPMGYGVNWEIVNTELITNINQ